MGTIVASSIMDKAARTIQDETNVRWTLQEHLDALNDGQREAVLMQPEAYTRSVVLLATAGARQEIPSDGIRFIKVANNCGADGLTQGRSVEPVSLAVVDKSNPDWRAMAPEGVSQHYMHDKRTPKVFYLYPPQPGVSPHHHEVVFSASPPDVVLPSHPISIDDTFSNALYYYMLFRAHTKEAEVANGEKANSYYNLFLGALGSGPPMKGAA